MRHEILSAIAYGQWHMDAQYASGMHNYIQSLLSDTPIFTPEEIAHEHARREAFFTDISGASRITSKNAQPNNEQQYIAVVNMLGPILKHSQYCGPMGTKDIANSLINMCNQPNVIGAIILAETGGGQTSGVKPLADAIKSIDKPVICFTEDLLASAGYAIGSYCDEIWCSSKMDIVGSIGAMITIADMKSALEAKGIKIHEIYATASTHKNNEFKAALEGDYKPIIKNLLDPVNENMHAEIRANRGEKLGKKSEKVFTGEIYQASEALELGLIDTIGSFNECLQRVSQLADLKNQQKSGTQQSLNNIDMKVNFKSSWSYLSSVLGFESKKEDAEVEMTEAHLESINAELATLDGIKAERDALVAEKATLTSSLTTMTADRDSWKTKADAYGKQAGEVPGAQSQKKEDKAADEGQNPYAEFMTSVDAEKAKIDAQWGKK